MINIRNYDFNPEKKWTLDIGTVSRKLLGRPGELSIKENKVIPAEQGSIYGGFILKSLKNGFLPDTREYYLFKNQ